MSNIDLRRNVSQRTPCVLVLDHSQSMDERVPSGRTRMQELNIGLEAFAKSLQNDPVALSRVQVAIVSVSGNQAELLLDWTDATEFEPFELYASGGTPLGHGLTIALDCIENQKRLLRENGIPYTRPWLLVLTDGQPTDDPGVWAQGSALTKQAEADGKVQVFPIGVGGADLEALGRISTRPPLALDSLHFRELFVWLSASLGQMTRSAPGQSIDLPPTSGWSSVKL
jgi:uncharacterized protein YegL